MSIVQKDFFFVHLTPAGFLCGRTTGTTVYRMSSSAIKSRRNCQKVPLVKNQTVCDTTPCSNRQRVVVNQEGLQGSGDWGLDIDEEWTPDVVIVHLLLVSLLFTSAGS